MNVTCPKCGQESVSAAVVAGMVKCGHCTEWFTAPSANMAPCQELPIIQAVKLTNCPTCARKVSSEAKACPNCGQPLQPAESRDNFAGRIIIVVILVVVALLMLLGASPSLRILMTNYH